MVSWHLGWEEERGNGRENFTDVLYSKSEQSLGLAFSQARVRSIKSFTNILILVDIIKERLHVILFWYKLVGETLYSQILLGSK